MTTARPNPTSATEQLAILRDLIATQPTREGRP